MWAMDGLLEQFDMLDFVLAVFGALIVAMWFGRGKSLKGILLGALMGGFVKPLVFGALLFGGFQLFAASDNDDTQPSVSQEDLMKILDKQ